MREVSPLSTWLSSRLELVTWAWAIGTASCLGRPQSLCPDLGSVPTEGPACCSCPGCHAQPFSNHSSCGSAGSQEPAQLWRAHVHLWRECRRGAEALGGGRSRRLFWPNAVISLEHTQPCPDSAAARARLGQVGPQSQEPRAGGGSVDLASDRASGGGGAFGLHPSMRAWAGEAQRGGAAFLVFS